MLKSLKMMVLLVALSMAAGNLWANGKNESVMKLRVGIVKYISHPALEALETGIIDELQEQFISVEFDNQNAFGNITSAYSIARKFKNEKVHIAVGIATPTAVALAETIDDIPVIFTGVTDPVDAGLVPSLNQSAGNVTGVMAMTPVMDQLELLASLIKLETLGYVYTLDEANAVRVEKIARDFCEERGIELISVPIVQSSELRLATQSFIDRVDAIYVGTDNTVVSNITTLTEVAVNAGIPVMSADPIASRGTNVFLAWGFDYYKMGRATGRLITEVVEGTDPASVPTRFMSSSEDMNMFINLRIANELKIDIPESLLAGAEEVER